jgi:hypothetical protein
MAGRRTVSGGALPPAKVLSSKPKIFRRAGLPGVADPCPLSKMNDLQAVWRLEVLMIG